VYDKRHRVHCDKALCGEIFVGGQGRTSQNLLAAREAGWHVSPCNCTWRSEFGPDRWRHKRDYCPAHFPKKPKLIVNLPPLLPGFTLH
jgi:hypothetical protein